ncbi:MAG: MerR family transcriptional regulator, partial [Kutzneria sp.]|nr:MerR family transcriptional regulator [Kutzneria sp.]
PGCGFPYPTPAAAEPETPPIACTLSGDGQAGRIHHWRQLLAHAVNRQAIDHGLRITLPAALTGQVAELAAAEQQCCAFFDLVLHLTGGQLRLEVRAPDDASALLTEIFGTAD